MKRATLYLTVILAFALCPILSQAQGLLKANVPFDFTVGDASMTSGVYLIQNAADHTQLIRNPETNKAAFVMSNSIIKVKPDLSKYVLVFHRYGSEYVLTQIWAGERALEVRQSKRVIELAKTQNSKEVLVAMVRGN